MGTDSKRAKIIATKIYIKNGNYNACGCDSLISSKTKILQVGEN